MHHGRSLGILCLVVAALGCYSKAPGESAAETANKSAADAASSQAELGPSAAAATADAAVGDPVNPGEAAADGGAGDLDLTCVKGGSVAALRVEFTCRVIVVYTCKDLSNVVIEFEDGTRQRFEGQSGHVNTFSGTGQNAGKRVVRVWVKAGANHSGEGPGYGQRVETTVTSCPPPPSAGAGGCVAGPDAPCGDSPGGTGGTGGCVAGPDMPCGDVPSAGFGGSAGSAGAGGSDDGDPDGPQ